MHVFEVSNRLHISSPLLKSMGNVHFSTNHIAAFLYTPWCHPRRTVVYDFPVWGAFPRNKIFDYLSSERAFRRPFLRSFYCFFFPCIPDTRCVIYFTSSAERNNSFVLYGGLSRPATVRPRTTTFLWRNRVRNLRTTFWLPSFRGKMMISWFGCR